MFFLDLVSKTKSIVFMAMHLSFMLKLERLQTLRLRTLHFVFFRRPVATALETVKHIINFCVYMTYRPDVLTTYKSF